MINPAKWLKDVITDAIKGQFALWMPKLIDAVVAAVTAVGKALVVAVVTASVEKAGEVVDDVTDLLPGTLDDQIFDPIAAQAKPWVEGILKRFGFGL